MYICNQKSSESEVMDIRKITSSTSTYLLSSANKGPYQQKTLADKCVFKCRPLRLRDLTEHVLTLSVELGQLSMLLDYSVEGHVDSISSLWSSIG